MEKLNISHIAPYLPYGLKCQCRDLGILELTSVSTINKDYQCWFESALDYNNRDFNYGILSRNSECGIGFNLDKIKPLLHPLSDLYKEIDGKVGIVELAKIAVSHHFSFEHEFKPDISDCGRIVRIDSDGDVFEFQMSSHDGYTVCLTEYEDGESYDLYVDQLEIFTYLFQHHYDVYGLIDKGLAIDINSISHE